jgi:hypothetical protein
VFGSIEPGGPFHAAGSGRREVVFGRDVAAVLDDWIRGLEARHLRDLQFPEVSRALRALSSVYVERRRALAGGAALSGAGKRAAFALYYGPLHYLLVREIVSALAPPGGASTVVFPTLVDLGCGTGAAGAAWAAAAGTPPPAIVGVDRHPWPLQEAAWTYRQLGLRGRTRLHDFADVGLPPGRAAFIAAFSMNELSDERRDAVLSRLLARGAKGDPVLVVEPLAGFVAPWWERWRGRFESAGGRADQWRVKPAIPAIVEKLGRAAGLRHTELTGRSLWMPGSAFTPDPSRA